MPALAAPHQPRADQPETAEPAAAPGWYRNSQATDQNWRYSEVQEWYHIDQGTAVIPLDWLLALEQPPPDASTTTEAAPEPGLFGAPAHMQQFGFLLNPPSDAYNRHGLPVGFSTTDMSRAARPPFACRPGQWAGLTCAACHTGQIDYRGTSIRIEGGPAHHDIETFRDRLRSALQATLHPARLQRFADRLDQPREQAAAELQCYVAALAVGEVVERIGGAGDDAPTPSGYGRLDALGRGGNFLFAESTGRPANYEPTTAPVSFPPLWDTPYFDWVLYNRSVQQPLARNVVEALGVGAPLDLSTLKGPRLVHGLQMDNLVRIQEWLEELRSPEWPAQILGELDQPKVERGQQIYRDRCTGCHQLIDRATHEPADAVGQSAEFLQIRSFRLSEIKTDPRQAVNFANRELRLGLPEGPQPLWQVAKTVTTAIVEQYENESDENRAKAKAINRGRANEFQAREQYRARPLNGIWATAPFLHNGSVPDLYQLLLPPAQRTKAFYVGRWEFDPHHVGFDWRTPAPGAFLLDTSLPGNSNAGHDYGTDLSQADRMALIEFLKSL